MSPQYFPVRCAAPRSGLLERSSIFDGFTDILVNFEYLKRLDFKQHATFRGPADFN